MLTYKDLGADGNGNDAPDGKITPEDQAWICDYATSDRTSPPITYGLSFGFSWTGLSLDGLLSGGAGNKLMMHADGRAIQGRAEAASYGYWPDDWTPDT